LKYTTHKKRANPYGQEILKIYFIYSQSKINHILQILRAYQKFRRVFHKTPITHAHIINKNGVLYEPISHFLNKKYAINATNHIFKSFHTILEIRENSIFIFACIRARIEEFNN